MKIPKLLPRKKLRAATARRSLGAPSEMDFDEMSEPNMKLSRALLIVLVLHVVAVTGIIAFNSIKTRQPPLVSPPAKTNNGKVAAPPAVKIEEVAPTAAIALPTGRHEDVKLGHPPTKTAKEERKPERAKTLDSGKTYVVAKGDNPVSIAKKLKVSYDELLAINHIDDPHKLQIGQKLIVPIKKAKKSDE
ncbi:MAG: LysM peptidoglycan-binding domain-containing protein [Chthoniobacterales bacterium]